MLPPLRDYDALIAFHSKYELEKLNPNLVGNAILVPELERAGVASIFVPKDYYNFDGQPSTRGYMAAIAIGSGLVLDRTVREVPIGGERSIQAVRSRIATPEPLNGLVPIVNGNRLRHVGASKWLQYILLQEFMAPTILIAEGSAVEKAKLEALASGLVVIKADKGQASQWLKISSAAEAVHDIREMRAKLAVRSAANKDIIVQAYRPGRPIRELRGYSPEDQAAMQTLGHFDSAELRMYCFAHPTPFGRELNQYGVYRLHAGQPNEAFVAIDQDSIPREAVGICEVAVDRILQSRQDYGGLVAVDILYDQMGAYGIREVNTGDPVLAQELNDNTSLHAEQMKYMVKMLLGIIKYSTR